VIIRKSAQEIETMARAGTVVAETLALLEEQIQPGITTGELDAIAEEHIRSRGGEPTFKGYKGYPAATCLSPNSMVVHGIPGAVKLQDGDVLSVDVGVTLDGFVADSAWTFPVGTISAEAQRLLDTCRAALEAGSPGRASGTRSRTSPGPSRRSPRQPGSASSGASWATASGVPCTRTRRCRTSSRATPGRSSRRG
jgi:methionyl aminopeptidase